MAVVLDPNFYQLLPSDDSSIPLCHLLIGGIITTNIIHIKQSIITYQVYRFLIPCFYCIHPTASTWPVDTCHTHTRHYIPDKN